MERAVSFTATGKVDATTEEGPFTKGCRQGRPNAALDSFGRVLDSCRQVLAPASARRPDRAGLVLFNVGHGDGVACCQPMPVRSQFPSKFEAPNVGRGERA